MKPRGYRRTTYNVCTTDMGIIKHFLHVCFQLMELRLPPTFTMALPWTIGVSLPVTEFLK